MGGVVLLVIGPKVEVVQAHDEDATVFMPMAQVTRVTKGVAAAAAGPVEQQDAKPVAAKPASSKVAVLLLALLVVAAAAFWAVRLLV